ncbi:MAG: uroporphyrinogen decarboxylase [Candidatus Sericytochromatia bacterium]|nr:uroporphyrinogen decarboxylase [Candidatus Sericytochromatia bacterium]
MSTKDFLVRAARKEPVDRVPVWIMRQAGRYMKEYMAIRKNYEFMTLCRTPELAAEISMQPIDVIGMDAGIIFSDILVPVEAMGIKVTFEKDHGPKLHNPITNYDDVVALKIPEPDVDMPFVAESIKLFREKLDDKLPVLGFSGAPWTLAAYMIEGGGSRNYTKIKSLMFNDKKTFDLLMEKTTETVVKHLYAQIKAGTSMVQIFDTWAGCLAYDDYVKYAFPYEKEVITRLKKLTDVPVTLYINGCGNILEKMVETQADVLSIDWMVDLKDAKNRVGKKVALQGNMDPCCLYGSPESVKQKTLETLNKFGKETGYIFNLGHGILPDIPVENVKVMVDTVKNF